MEEEFILFDERGSERRGIIIEKDGNEDRNRIEMREKIEKNREE